MCLFWFFLFGFYTYGLLEWTFGQKRYWIKWCAIGNNNLDNNTLRKKYSVYIIYIVYILKN